MENEIDFLDSFQLLDDDDLLVPVDNELMHCGFMSPILSSENDNTSETYTNTEIDRLLIDLSCQEEEEQQEEIVTYIPIAKRKKKKKIPWGKKKRHEVEYLRTKVNELETKLVSLQDGDTGTSKSSMNSSDILLWEKVAKHQMKEKIKSEEENKRLKQLLEGQVKLAKNLEKILSRRPEMTDMERTLSNSKKQFKMKFSNKHQDLIFQQLEQNLEKRYEEVDTILKETGLDQMCTELSAMEVQVNKESDDIFLQLLDVKKMPFEWQTTWKAVWKILSQRHIKLQNGFFQAENVVDDILHVNFAVSLSVRRVDILLQAYSSGRKFQDTSGKERMVLVYQTLCRHEGNVKDIHELELREQGWLTVERESDTSTILKTCTRLTPVWSADFSSSESKQTRQAQHIETLTDLLIGSFNQNTKVLYQHVENLLMEQTLCKLKK